MFPQKFGLFWRKKNFSTKKFFCDEKFFLGDEKKIFDEKNFPKDSFVGKIFRMGKFRRKNFPKDNFVGKIFRMGKFRRKHRFFVPKNPSKSVFFGGQWKLYSFISVPWERLTVAYKNYKNVYQNGPQKNF
jgi:hypothetical protein